MIYTTRKYREVCSGLGLSRPKRWKQRRGDARINYSKMKPEEKIKVQVHYMAATKPFKTEEEPATTVGQLKAAALTAFGLKEDTTKVYKLFYQKLELTNLSQTLGEIAGHQRDLNLKLEEVLIQGAGIAYGRRIV